MSFLKTIQMDCVKSKFFTITKDKVHHEETLQDIIYKIIGIGDTVEESLNHALTRCLQAQEGAFDSLYEIAELKEQECEKEIRVEEPDYIMKNYSLESLRIPLDNPENHSCEISKETHVSWVCYDEEQKEFIPIFF